MAGPAYKPLAVAVQGSLPGVFDTAPVDFTDAQKVQAALRAQELANESNEIKLQETQRQVESQNVLRQRLQQQFAPQEDGTSTEFDPDQALKLAQTIAIQSGDLDTALAIEKTQKERRATSVPYNETERALLSKELGYDAPEGLSPSFMNTLSSLRGKNLYGQSLEDNRNKYSDMQASLLPEGYEGNPTSDDSKKFKTTLIATQNVGSILDQLQESVSRTGSDQVTGADYVLQRQLVGDLALALKGPGFGNLGAALSPSEYELLLTQLPILLSTPNSSLGRVLTEQGLGRDPIDAIRNLKNKINRTIDIEGAARNIRKKSVDPILAGANSANQPFMIPRTNNQGAGGVPGVGGMFNGEKVLNVQKIE